MEVAIAVVMLFGMVGYLAISHKGSPRTGDLDGTPRATIAEFPDGSPARLVGTIVDGEQIAAPLTGRSCVLHETTVEHLVSVGPRGHRSPTWTILVREVRGGPLIVADDTARAIVDPEGAELDLELEYDACSDRHQPANEVQRALLERHAVAIVRGDHERAFRFRERIITIGASIAVYGVGTREPSLEGAPTTGYRDALPVRLRISNAPHVPLSISDDRHDIRGG